MEPGYAVAGFVVGAMVGITGVGGGALMTPLLVLLFGVQPSVAVGTDLLYAAITKTGGTAVHARLGTVDWRIAALLALGSLPTAATTLWGVTRFAPGGLGGASSLVSVTLGAALLLTAVALFFRRRLAAYSLVHGAAHETARRTAALTVATGVVLGALVTISSVGAGALGVVALVFLYPKLPAARIVGTDIAHAVALTLVAGLGHWLLGSIDWALLGWLLIGSLPGVFLGSRLAARVPERVLRLLLGCMLLMLGGRLVVQ
jgi:uncharacterized membrane protein YfcA